MSRFATKNRSALIAACADMRAFNNDHAGTRWEFDATLRTQHEGIEHRMERYMDLLGLDEFDLDGLDREVGDEMVRRRRLDKRATHAQKFDFSDILAEAGLSSLNGVR